MQEVDRRAHLVHAVQAILNTDPTRVADVAENLKDRVVVVQALTGNAVLQGRRVSYRAVALQQVFKRIALGEIAVAGVHADHSVGYSAQQFDRIIAGDDGVGWIVLYAEMLALGDGVQQFKEDVHLLRELRVFPESVLIMVLQSQHDIMLPRHREHCFNAFDHPL